MAEHDIDSQPKPPVTDSPTMSLGDASIPLLGPGLSAGDFNLLSGVSQPDIGLGVESGLNCQLIHRPVNLTSGD